MQFVTLERTATALIWPIRIKGNKDCQGDDNDCVLAEKSLALRPDQWNRNACPSFLDSDGAI